MTLPAVLYHSFEIPVYGLLLNLVIVPFMTYVLVSGIFALAASLLWLPAGIYFLGGAHYILAFYRFVCELVETFWDAYPVLGRPELWQILFYYGCLNAGVWIAANGKKRLLETGIWKRTVSGALVLGIGFLVLMFRISPDLEVTFLDVGQGDGIVIQTGNTVILVDCGSSQDKSIGKNRLVPFLKCKGIDQVDLVFVTHGDQDHISGIQYILENPGCEIQIGQLLFPVTSIGDPACERLRELADEREIPVGYLHAGNFLELPGSDAAIRCLYPDAGSTGEDKNNGSLVLRLDYKDFSMLLTGDVEEEGEGILLQKGEVAPVTVLKAAHHGSASSTSQSFLQAADPDYVIFSYGAGNRYGHPADAVTERCEGIGAELYRTAVSGAITIQTDGKKMQIRGWLDRKEGIW